jgi:hypothetical protein
MKQSVYISDSEHARWKALGVSLGDVVRAGLATLESARTLSAGPVHAERAVPSGTGVLHAPAREDSIPAWEGWATDSGMHPEE